MYCLSLSWTQSHGRVFLCEVLNRYGPESKVLLSLLDFHRTVILSVVCLSGVCIIHTLCAPGGLAFTKDTANTKKQSYQRGEKQVSVCIEDKSLFLWLQGRGHGSPSRRRVVVATLVCVFVKCVRPY